MTVTAEAVASDVSCDNEVVSVPERGRIDVVTRSLIVKVGALKKDNKEVYSRNIFFFQLIQDKIPGSHIILCLPLSQAEGTEMTKVHNWLLCPKGRTNLRPGMLCQTFRKTERGTDLYSWLLWELH